MLISSILNGSYEGIQKLGRSRYWFLFLGMVFLFVIFINGIGIVPEQPYQRLAENPFMTRTDIHFNNYWQENPLLPVIAFYLGLSSPIAFNILCFIILTGAFSLFALLTMRQLGSVPAFIFSSLLITNPLTTVLLTWLGTPDGLTVALTIPFLFTQSWLLVFLLSVFGAMNHPTFMITVIEILILRWVAKDGIKLNHVIASGLGLAVGHTSTRLFLTVNQIEIVSRLDFMQLKDTGEWLKMNAVNLPITLSSLFNIQWLVLLLCLVLFFKRDKVFYSLVLAFLMINYGFTLVTLDTTRIFSLLSWGVLFACIIHSYHLASLNQGNDQEMQRQFLLSLVLIGIASFVTPRYFSWAGEIHTTPFYQFIRAILK